MKTAQFEDVSSENVFDYEVHRNSLGWQLSFASANIATFISHEEAAQIIKMMDDQDIKDQAYEVD